MKVGAPEKRHARLAAREAGGARWCLANQLRLELVRADGSGELEPIELFRVVLLVLVSGVADQDRRLHAEQPHVAQSLGDRALAQQVLERLRTLELEQPADFDGVVGEL